TGDGPIAVVTGYFNGDKYLDVAVLSQNDAEITVYDGDGAGGLEACCVASAGNVPTGLFAADVNRDGSTDLLVGNAFGDILTLTGLGDGTFLPYQRSDRTVSLAVTDLDGDGIDDFVLANESLDEVTVEYSRTTRFVSRTAGGGVLGDRDTGLLAPS